MILRFLAYVGPRLVALGAPVGSGDRVFSLSFFLFKLCSVVSESFFESACDF